MDICRMNSKLSLDIIQKILMCSSILKVVHLCIAEKLQPWESLNIVLSGYVQVMIRVQLAKNTTYVMKPFERLSGSLKNWIQKLAVS